MALNADCQSVVDEELALLREIRDTLLIIARNGVAQAKLSASVTQVINGDQSVVVAGTPSSTAKEVVVTEDSNGNISMSFL